MEERPATGESKIAAMMVGRIGLSAEAAGARTLFDCHISPGCTRNARLERSVDRRGREYHVHEALRRHESLAWEPTDELTELTDASNETRGVLQSWPMGR